MAGVIYSVAVSLDGFVARPDLNLDWLGPFMASGDDYTGAFIDSMGVLIVGSRTYAESEQTMEWFGRGPCSSKPVYVFTSRELPVAGPNITLTDASPERFVTELDARGVAQAGLLSGPGLLSSFRTGGLVTGYFLGVIPVVLGADSGCSTLRTRPSTFGSTIPRSGRTGLYSCAMRRSRGSQPSLPASATAPNCGSVPFKPCERCLTRPD